jgi:hypothetical protein
MAKNEVVEVVLIGRRKNTLINGRRCVAATGVQFKDDVIIDVLPASLVSPRLRLVLHAQG